MGASLVGGIWSNQDPKMQKLNVWLPEKAAGPSPADADMALEFENPALVVIWLQHFTSFFLAWKHTVIASNLT